MTNSRPGMTKFLLPVRPRLLCPRGRAEDRMPGTRAGILEGLSVTECAAFIACPYATMTLAELGAEVIRIDGMAGGLDYKRWPVTRDNRSLYWAGLNKGK